MQCVILAGGLGTRLGELTRETPKPMLPVNGRPFIEYLLAKAIAHGAEEALILAGYKSHVLKDHFHTGYWRNEHIPIRVVVEPTPLGTGGALRNALEYLRDEFLLLNGDSFFDFDWSKLFTQPLAANDLCILASREIDNTDRYGRLIVIDNRVTKIIKDMAGPGYINGGVYRISNKMIKNMAAGQMISLENEVLPVWCAGGKICTNIYSGFFIDIGIPDDYYRAQILFQEYCGLGMKFPIHSGGFAGKAAREIAPRRTTLRRRGNFKRISQYEG